MIVIIPKNEHNDKIVFDFRDQVSPKELDSWKVRAKFALSAKEKELGRYLTPTERKEFISKYSVECPPYDIDKYILVVKKECLDHRFKNMSNKDIFLSFKQNLIIVKFLDFFLNTHIADNPNISKFYRYVRRYPYYIPKYISSDEELNISLSLWKSSEQTVAYHEKQIDTINGEKDFTINYEFLGLSPVKILIRDSEEDRKKDR